MIIDIAHKHTVPARRRQVSQRVQIAACMLELPMTTAGTGSVLVTPIFLDEKDRPLPMEHQPGRVKLGLSEEVSDLIENMLIDRFNDEEAKELEFHPSFDDLPRESDGGGSE